MRVDSPRATLSSLIRTVAEFKRLLDRDRSDISRADSTWSRASLAGALINLRTWPRRFVRPSNAFEIRYEFSGVLMSHLTFYRQN
ncbi:hypothetical protein EVAR_81015_1 [Eumeta japonica]|uniref:Uncharacterized protein n=1 Tax=Eumeta variegata TaxID=151549 RepID=A0A4C1T6A1_EUMVA|nr:hypothetical protein EVAR_81015_1 [Eumeta japonica]